MELTHLIGLMTGVISILVLDLKGEYRDIPDLLGRDRWFYFDAANGFRLGWNPPRKCLNYHGWTNNLTKVLCAGSDLKFSEAVLAAVIRIAFNILNNPLPNPVLYPSPLLIEQLLSYLPPKMITTKLMYLESVLHKIRYIRRIAGTLFEAERGFDLFEHLIKPGKSAVINCATLNPLLVELLVNILCLQFNFTKISLHETSQQTTYVLVVDEGDQLASRAASAKYPEGYSEYARGFKQLRAFGGTDILGVTSFADSDPIISANTEYHFIFNQADSGSIHEAAQTLLEPHSTHLISSLKCGQAIFKEVMGNISYGIPVAIDLVPASHPEGTVKTDTHPFTLARGIEDIPDFQNKLRRWMAEYQSTLLRQSKAAGSPQKVTKTERAFLDYLSLKAYEPVHILFGRIGDIPAGVQQQILKKLEALSLIETTPKVRTGKIYVRFARFTEAGLNYMNKA